MENTLLNKIIIKTLPKWLLRITMLLIPALHTDAQTFDWAVQTQSNNACVGQSVAPDKSGNVYMIGNFQDSTDLDPGAGSAVLTPLSPRDVFLAKYDNDGNYLWSKRIMTGSAFAYCVALDATGNVYVSGNFLKTSYFNTGSGMDSLTNISAQPIAFLTKYDNNGNYVWAKALGGGYSKSGTTARGISIGRSGDLYLTGLFADTVDFDPGANIAKMVSISTSTNRSNLFIAKYDADGNYIWAKGVGGTNYVQGFAIALDTTDLKEDIIVTGLLVGTADFDPGTQVANLTGIGANDAFVARYDSSGAYLWANAMGGTGVTAQSQDITIDALGNTYITGFFRGGTMDFDPGADTAMRVAVGSLADMFIAKYDTGGHYVWAKSIGAGGGAVSGFSIASDKGGAIYVGGYMMMATPVDFDPGPDTAMLTLGGTMEGFIAKYDACGEYVWAGNTKGQGNSAVNNTGRDIAINEKGEAFLTGSLSGTADFDPGTNATPLTSYKTGTDAYLLKINFDVDTIPVTYLTVTECSESYAYNGTVYSTDGTYKHLLRGSSHCDSIVILNLTFSRIEEPVITINEFTLGVNNSYATYQWIKNGTPVSGATADTYAITENADYQVAVTNEAGCADTSEVYKVNNYTSIENRLTLAKQIHVYPNPTHDILHLYTPVPVNIMLTDVTGRPIMEVKNAQDISLKHLNAGMYLMQVQDRNDVLLHTIKVVKQ